MFLAPAQRTFTAAELVKGGKFIGRSDAVSMDARVTEISSIVYPQVRDVVQLYAPDTVHVFTHAGDDAPCESLAGLFKNRNYYYSALRSHNAVDDYTEVVIPIDIASGTLSFKVESDLTAKFSADYKYIKDVANGEVAWDTVIVNSAEGNGTHSADTRVYVSFGFGLKKCLEDQTITFNPRGRVTGPQERKPHAQRSTPARPLPAHTPATKRKISSSQTSKKNLKLLKPPKAQVAAAVLVRHTDMAQKLFDYVKTHDIKKSTINKSTLKNKSVYHGLL